MGVQNGTTTRNSSPINIRNHYRALRQLPECEERSYRRGLGDTAVVTEWLKKQSTGGRGRKVTDKAYFGTGLNIAVRQGNTDLQRNLTLRWKKVKKRRLATGAIYNKWFQK